MQRVLLAVANRILLALALVSPLVATAADPLVIYSGRSDKFVLPVIEQFTKDTGIEVIVHAGKSTELLNKLQLEGEATKADLFISNDAGNLQVGAERGLFAKLPDELLANVPDNYRAADGSWTGLSARARVLVANRDAIDAGNVNSVFDLADPKLAGKIAITTSANESFIAGVTVYQRAVGDEKVSSWLAGLRDNAEGEAYAKHSHVVRDVAAGRKSIGLVNHYYVFRHLADNPDAPLTLVVPDQADGQAGVAWNVAGIALTAASKRAEEARKLVAFLLSPTGQTQFSEVNREYPVVRDMQAADELPGLDSMRVANVPMADLGKHRSATLDLIEAAQLP